MTSPDRGWPTNSTLSPWLQRELETAHGAHRAWVQAALDQTAEVARLRVVIQEAAATVQAVLESYRADVYRAPRGTDATLQQLVARLMQACGDER